MKVEVSGAWFVSMRNWARRQPSDLDQEIQDRMPNYARIYRDASHNEWYEEDALGELFCALYDHCGRNDAAFLELSRVLAEEGVGRFFRSLLGLTSVRFLMRQAPTMWKRLRRGDTTTFAVEPSAEGTVLRYVGFPWLARDEYMVAMAGTLLALARMVDPTASIRYERPEPTSVTYFVRHR